MAGLDSFPGFVTQRPLTRDALIFGADAHGGQRREGDDAPFILHPLEVAAFLDAHAFSDEVTAAAVLHDTIEETGVACADIRDRFGLDVARLVSALTEDEGIEPDADRKAALRAQVAGAGRDAAAIYAADKISKVREVRIRLTRDPSSAMDPAARAKIAHYKESLTMLEATLGDHPLVSLLRFELEMMNEMPPGGVS